MKMRMRRCDCGRVLYEDIAYCPSCNRPMKDKPFVTQWDEETNKRAEALYTAKDK